jgi:hypothetical protein
VAAGLLRDDLLSLPGVERADLDGGETNPFGIRVRLAPGADSAVLGEEIRRVLAAHGLRSEVVGVRSGAAPIGAHPSAAPLRDTRPVVAIDEMPASDGASEHEAADRSEPVIVIDEPPVPREDPHQERTGGRGGSPTGLDAVAVVEDREGITITASGAGGTASARAATTARPAVDQAVVSAVARLVGVVAVPLIRSIDEREIGDTAVATVVIDEGGERLVGSAVVEGGWAYALGRAAWAAFSSREVSGGIS